MKIKIIICIMIIITNINAQSYHSSESDIPSLKEVFKNYFMFGSGAIGSKKYVEDDNYKRFILKHYNTLNINTFYPIRVHPKEGVYNFDTSDLIVDFAVKNNLYPRGHVLVWYNEKGGIGGQWMLKDKTGNSLSRDEALKNMEDHIKTIVGRYKGSVKAWDVVNEAIDVKESDSIRKCLLKDVIGPDYIEKAFIFAHEADPDAKLFYNDYNEYEPKKRDAIYKMLKLFKAKGIPVNGLGMQMHIKLNKPTLEELDSALALYSTLGLDINITEMDVDMNPSNELTVFTDKMNDELAERYSQIFTVLKKYSRSIKAVYTWGIDDGFHGLRQIRKRERTGHYCSMKTLSQKKHFGA